MKHYRVTIAERKTYKQFVCDVSATSEVDASKTAMQAFFREYWEHSAHCKVIMCNEILNI